MPATCPDWAALVASREAGGDRAEAEWRQALSHLDACDGCRRPALSADPTLLFRSLPRVEVAALEAAAMRQAVASMRRARRVAPAPPAGRLARALTAISARGRSAAAVGRRTRHLAAAALLAAASGGLWVALPTIDPAAAPDVAPAASREAAPTSPKAAPTGRTALPADAATSAGEPVFMDLSLPSSADVYRVGSGGLQVVMVVDERLDV